MLRRVLAAVVALSLLGLLVFYVLGGRVHVSVTGPNVDVNGGRLPNVQVEPGDVPDVKVDPAKKQ